MTKRKIKGKTIAFQTLPCLRCGAIRVLGGPCQECDLKPPSGEINALVVQRRTAVRRVQEQLASLDTASGGDNPDIPSLDEIETHIWDFIEALENLLMNVNSDETITRIAGLERSLSKMWIRCKSVAPLRPEVAKHGATMRCLSSLTELWPTYAKALQAPSVSDAKRFADRGQWIIDSVADEIARYDILVKSTRAYKDLSVPDFLDRTLEALTVSHPEVSLLDLPLRGSQEASSLTGVAVDGVHGAQFLALVTAGSIAFDEERFTMLLKETAKFCIDNSRIIVIAAEPGALEGLAAASRLLWESLTSFEATLLKEKDEKALIRRAIKFYGEIYEDVAGPLFAWYNLLAGIKSQPYLKLVQSDVTALARNLVRHPPTSSFLEGDGGNLRNAAQHGNSYTLDGDQILFSLRSYQGNMSYGEVIDQIFSFLESTTAMSWSLSNTLTQTGCALPLNDADAAYMNLSPFRLAKLWLTNRGTQHEADQSNTSWSFTVESDPSEILEVAITLMMSAPEEVSEVSVRKPGSTTFLEVPFAVLEPFTAAHGATLPIDVLLSILEVRNACKSEGTTLLRVSDLKFTTGTLGIFVLLNGDNSLIPRLRRTRELASLIGANDVIDVIKQVFIQIRSPDETKKRHLSTKLNKWLGEKAPAVPRSDAVTVTR